MKIKFISLLLSLLMLVSACTSPVFAAEKTGGIGDCDIEFYISDTTNGKFIDVVTITLYNKELSLEYTCKLTNVNYVLNMSAGLCVKQGTYTMTVQYAGEEEYTLENSDGTDISYVFNADSEQIDFKWKVVSNKTETEDKKTNPFDTFEGDKRAHMLFMNFIEALSVATNNYQYDKENEHQEIFYYLYLDIDGSHILKDFKEYLSDGTITEEQFRELFGDSDGTKFMNSHFMEQYLQWVTRIVTYGHRVRDSLIIEPELPNFEVVSYEEWTNYILTEKVYLKSDGNSEMVDAYEELMQYAWYYYNETGTRLDFIKNAEILGRKLPWQSGYSSGDKYFDVTLEDESLREKENSETTGEISETSEKSETPKTEGGEDEKRKGIWDDTIELLKENAITILLLVALASIVICIALYKKRNTIKDNY